MPNRIIKETICTSDTIERLTPFEETFFYRLIVNCDDYGRMDARPAILKSKLFPLKERLALRDVQGALQKLADTGCVKLYEVEHKPYLYLPTWEVHQRVRNCKSKFPEPSDGNPLTVDRDLPSTAPVIQSNPNPNPESKTREDALAGIDGELRTKLEEWMRYKQERREAYKPTGLRNLVSEVKNKRSVYSDAQICALISECMANGWRGIIWDKLKGFPGSSPRPNKSAQTGRESSLDMEKIHRMLHGGGE